MSLFHERVVGRGGKQIRSWRNLWTSVGFPRGREGISETPLNAGSPGTTILMLQGVRADADGTKLTARQRPDFNLDRQVQLPWRVIGQMQQQCGQGGNCSCNYFAVEFSPDVNGEATPAQICSEISTRCSLKTSLTWDRNLFILLLYHWPPSRSESA